MVFNTNVLEVERGYGAHSIKMGFYSKSIFKSQLLIYVIWENKKLRNIAKLRVESYNISL